MKEAHKLGRTKAIRAAFNSKRPSWLTKRFEVKQTHNFSGQFIERCEYKNGKVTVYDIKGKEIESHEASKAVKDIQKLPKATDGEVRKSPK